MAMRGPRLHPGSAAWIADERAIALQIAQSDVEEFAFSARNDVEWLNEHMAEIFSENQINVADVFKTPGKLRGRTPRTARKANVGEVRAPLSSIFSATPKGAPNPFTAAGLGQAKPTPKLKVAEDQVSHAASPRAPTVKPALVHPGPTVDSPHHGYQSGETMEIDELALPSPNLKRQAERKPVARPIAPVSPGPVDGPSPTQPTVEPTFHSAKEEQTMTANVLSSPAPSPSSTRPPSPIRKPVPTPRSSPLKPSPQKPLSIESEVLALAPAVAADEPKERDVAPQQAEAESDEVRSPSDNSSPIRPVVRKSSMNFASLPAREPLASKKSVGAGMSRLSHLEQSRMSYYNRPTGGKSLGAAGHKSDDEDQDDMDIDDDDATVQNTIDLQKTTAAHNKSYTQRLQDRISLLGAKAPPTGSQGSRSQANSGSQNAFTPYSQSSQQAQQSVRPSRPTPAAMPPVSPEKQESMAAPGAFPTDDEDDWIPPPATVVKEPSIFSPRPVIAKSYSADVMEGVAGKATVGGSEFVLPRQRQQETAPGSPKREPTVPERGASVRSHNKSASVPHLPNAAVELDSPRKAISVSNPALATVPESGRPSATPSKSPSRTFRDSPLKQVKNKLSSILKSSKGLLASSAALSAEGKSSLLSPSTTRLGIFAGPSTESLVPGFGRSDALYPDLTKHAAFPEPQSPSRPESPARSTATRRTRASAEREKRENKQREKEIRDAQRYAGQMGKLEKAREKEREKARVFSEEQEKAALEKQPAGPTEKQRAPQPAPPSPTREAAKPTRTSPRKAKAQAESEGRFGAATPGPAAAHLDVDMVDAHESMAPPTVPRSAAPSQASRSVKRPIKPSKEAPMKTKQAPTVIRVNTSAQHSQFHPSNSVLAANLQDTLGPQQHHLKTKASTASLQTKPSLQSLKSSVSSNGRPKALELAAKRKEQEEREVLRRREAKAEMERKRVALQEEERRQDEQRRLEAQRQREREREQVAAQAEAKKSAQRQAAIEKAKQTRAPPPPPRHQPNGPPDYNASRVEPGTGRPPSRLNSTLQRPQDELHRPVNAVLSNAAKAPPKRPLQAEGNEESARPGIARNGPSHQHPEAKRMRMSEEFDEDELEMGGGQPSQSKIKGPPVRPSGGFKKELPQKSFFSNGYTTAPTSVARDLFKSTVTTQHNNQAKAAHPLDMAQVSKAAIPFAPNPNPAGPSTHKTPARPAGMQLPSKSAAKSATRSSPRFPNGDNIELPDIQTDDEDSEDDGHIGVAAWADSPDLRKALARQETIDPMQIFGPPGPLNMEEVFSKSKDRFHKFRARTSSANWSGADRLTEEDIRKDLAARDRLRREGGWSFELSKDLS